MQLLHEYGPALGDPHTSAIKGSKYPLRELKAQSAGRLLRVLYVFDPRRRALLLVGGDKTGDDRWYDRMVPMAENIFNEHLKAMDMESDKNG